MKKSLIIGSALMLCLTVASCGGKKKALDINVADLETACEFVDALETAADEMLVITEDGEVGTDEEEQFGKLMEKVEEISGAAESKHERSEAEKCENWDKLQEKVDDLEDYM